MVVTSGPFNWTKICLSVWTLSLGRLVRAKLGECITPLKSECGKGKTQVCGSKANSVVLTNLDSIHGYEIAG